MEQIPRNATLDIFLVDDDPLISDYYTYVLRKQQYIVEQCFSAPEAFTALSARLPKVCIFDYHIASHHGLDLYARCIEKKMWFEVLFCSASFQEDQIAQEVHKSGLAPCNFFPKTGNDNAFLQKVRFLYHRACAMQRDGR